MARNMCIRFMCMEGQARDGTENLLPWPLQPCCRLVNCSRIILQSFAHARNLLLGFLVALFFNAFAYTRQSFGAIAGVKTGSIDQVLVPGTARQSIRVGEPAFGLDELRVE